MDYILILWKGDINIIQDYAKEFRLYSNDELIDAYNQQVKTGMTGVHGQALYLCGLGHEFMRRFDESPIVLENNVLSLTGAAGLVHGHLVIDISKFSAQRAVINQEKDHIDKESPTIFIPEDKMLSLEFSSLIIRVESIKNHYGTLEAFYDEHGKFGITNGEILIMQEMNSPPHYLIEYVQNVLLPLGMKEKEDYLFADEELIYGVGYEPSPLLNKPHPACEHISWLGSIITLEGNFIWYKSDNEKV